MKAKRFGAIFIDFVVIFLFWYLLTKSDLGRVNTLLETLDPEVPGSLDIFAESVIKMLVAFVLKLLFVSSLYFCLLPAIIGRGKTLGKLCLRLSMVDEASGEEVSASKLILREFVGRCLVEILFVIPLIASIFLALFSKSGRTIHERISKTIVISD